MTLLRSGSATDVGRVRKRNEDHSLEESNIFAVADGMGGHAGGEVAAHMAIDALRSSFFLHQNVAGLRGAVAEANDAIWRQGQVQSDLRGMGTTLTAAALVGSDDGRDVIAIANVGDSRAYVYSGGDITQVTNDHSLAEEKVRQGRLTEEEAAVHPHRHILTRALGIGPEVDVDLWELHVKSGDRILLCSDGLTNEVRVSQIADVLAGVSDPREAAGILVRTAVEQGGHDNVTVVVIDVQIGEEAGSGGAPVASVGSAPPHAGAGPEGILSGSPEKVSDDDFFLTRGPVSPGPPPVLASRPPSSSFDASRKPGWWQRRRERQLAGNPPRLTFRVAFFFLLLVAFVVAAYGFVWWYANESWYVTVKGNHLVVYQGRPGGLLWFEPKLVDRTSVTTSEILPSHLTTLRGRVEEPSLSAARRYVVNLHQEYLTQKQADQRETTSGKAPTTVPNPFATVPPGTQYPTKSSTPAGTAGTGDTGGTKATTTTTNPASETTVATTPGTAPASPPAAPAAIVGAAPTTARNGQE